MLPVETAFKIYVDLAGKPLDNGYIYFGQANQNPVTSPVTVYWDAAGTQPAAQPLRTLNGYIVRNGTPSNVFYAGTYSELVQDKNKRQIYYEADSSNFSVASYVTDAIATISTNLAATTGSGLVGFDFALNYAANTIGWGTQTAGTSFNLLRLIPPSEWPAIANFTSTYDVTSVLTTAISTYRDVFMPRGKMRVNPAVGVLLVGSMRLRGAGQNETVLEAIANGATTAQLAAYTKGSIFKRAFTPGIANPRVDTVHMSDFAIVMNHPTGSVTTTDIQIGIDLRHVGRFNLERIWVGNIAPVGGPYVKADPGTFGIQGYGIVSGNIDSGNIAYCGGEVGTIRNCSVYGCFKNIVIDDLTLSPLSGAHAITIQDCDIQAGHSLIAQEQQYTTGCVFEDNTVQNVVRQPGNATPTYVYRIAGYENDIFPGYNESGVTDYIVRFDSASTNNRVRMGHYSATTIGIAAFSDAGRRNTVWCNKDTGTLPGGVDSKGIPIVRYDRSFSTMTIVAHWNGAAMVVDDGFGLTVTRPTTAGDYLFTFDLPVLGAKAYIPKASSDTNASGHGGLYAIISSTLTNVRIQFYAQNGATTTAIDPRFVFVEVKLIGGA